MKFLICGLGSIGYRHLKVLRKLGKHEIWAYRSGKSTLDRKVQKADAPDRTFFDLDEALRAAPTAVLVTNPTALHMDVIAKALKYKVALFIEKPLSHNQQGIDVLLKKVTAQRIPVLVGFNLMFHPAIIEIKKLLDKKVIGDIVSASAHWGSYMPAWHPWEDYRKTYAARKDMGGGATLTMCHELNYLTYFFGGVVKVKAMPFKKRTISITADEGIEALLEHTSKVISRVHLNFIQRPLHRTLELIGSAGTLFWDYKKAEVIVENDRQRKVYPLGKGIAGLLDESYMNQMKHFIRVVNRKEKSRVSLQKGIEDLDVCLKILKEIGNDY